MKQEQNGIDNVGEIKDPEHLSLFEKAEPFLRTRHNVIHTTIAYHCAMHLLTAEGGDPSIVIPAILLHDVGWSAIPEEQQLLAFGIEIRDPGLWRRHETEGAKLAAMILYEKGCPGDLVNAIIRIIDGHDTRTGALDLNDMIVRDADKLWRYSRTGFSIDANRFQCEPHKHVGWLTEGIKNWFFTRTAAQLAREEVEKRQEEMEASLA